MWNIESWGNSYNPKEYQASYEFYKGKKSQSNSNGTSPHPNLGGSRSKCCDCTFGCGELTVEGPTKCKKSFSQSVNDCSHTCDGNDCRCVFCKWTGPEFGGMCVSSKKTGYTASGQKPGEHDCVEPYGTIDCTNRELAKKGCKHFSTKGASEGNAAKCKKHYQDHGSDGKKACIWNKLDNNCITDKPCSPGT